MTIVGLIVLSDAPAQQLAQSTQAEPTARQPIGATLATVLTHPVCWQGFFTHWSGLMHQCIFTLLWGVPLMTLRFGTLPYRNQRSAHYQHRAGDCGRSFYGGDLPLVLALPASALFLPYQWL